MSSKAAHATLQPGRVVLLQLPATGLTELAVVIGAPDMASELFAESSSGGFGGGKKGGLLSGGSLGMSSSGGARGGGVGPDRKMWVLVLHTPGPLDTPAADDDNQKAAAAAVGKPRNTISVQQMNPRVLCEAQQLVVCGCSVIFVEGLWVCYYSSMPD